MRASGEYCISCGMIWLFENLQGNDCGRPQAAELTVDSGQIPQHHGRSLGRQIWPESRSGFSNVNVIRIADFQSAGGWDE